MKRAINNISVGALSLALKLAEGGEVFFSDFCLLRKSYFLLLLDRILRFSIHE